MGHPLLSADKVQSLIPDTHPIRHILAQRLDISFGQDMPDSDTQGQVMLELGAAPPATRPESGQLMLCSWPAFD